MQGVLMPGALWTHTYGGGGVSFSSKQLVAAERAFIWTVICWVISGAMMGLRYYGMAVMALVSVASFPAKHWILLSNPLNARNAQFDAPSHGDRESNPSGNRGGIIHWKTHSHSLDFQR